MLVCAVENTHSVRNSIQTGVVPWSGGGVCIVGVARLGGVLGPCVRGQLEGIEVVEPQVGTATPRGHKHVVTKGNTHMITPAISHTHTTTQYHSHTDMIDIRITRKHTEVGDDVHSYRAGGGEPDALISDHSNVAAYDIPTTYTCVQSRLVAGLTEVEVVE